MKRRIFDRQFVRLACSADVTVTQIARTLNISATTLYRWIAEWEQDKDNAFPGRGSPVINAAFEISKLHKKVAYLEQENALLKKYQAFLKRNPK